MRNKRIRIWNSELASRIDGQLKTQDQAIYRKMLTQNELNERQLRNLLRRWRRHGEGRSFSEFLVGAGLLSIESRSVENFESIACDCEKEEMRVVLKPEARFEPSRPLSVRRIFSQLASMLLPKVIPEPFKTLEAASTPLTHCLAEKGNNRSPTNRTSAYAQCELDSDEGAKRTCSAYFEETADEFDPYATVYT